MSRSRICWRTEATVLENRVDPLQELFRLVRLGDEIVGAGFEALHDVQRVLERRQQYHGNMLVARVRLDGAAEVVAGNPGHHDVADDEVYLRRVEDFQRLFA